MHAEYLVINDHAQRQVVKHVCKIVPYVGIAVFAGTLGIKSIGLCNAAGLVITAN